MTIKKFFTVFFFQAAAFTVLKFFFFSYFDYRDPYWELLYWAGTAILAVILVRRLGVINFLEAIFTLAFWFFPDLVLDAVVTAPLTSYAIFSGLAIWGGYVTMMLFVFFMHKKRHIHIRHELHAHHGHH